MRSGNTQIVVEVPAGFGRYLLRAARPEVAASVDGAMTFRGEEKWSVEHFSNRRAHVPDQHRKNRQHECRNGQSHVQEEILKLAE